MVKKNSSSILLSLQKFKKIIWNKILIFDSQYLDEKNEMKKSKKFIKVGNKNLKDNIFMD